MSGGRTSPVQRAAALCVLPSILRDFGVCPEALFRSHGVDPESLTPDSILPFGAALAIVEDAAKLTGCEHLGLLMGSRYSLRSHGPIAELMFSAPTLGQALTDFVTWQPGYSTGAAVYLHPVAGGHAWGYAAYDRRSAGCRHLYELAIAAGANFLQELTDGAVRPVEVHLSRRRPRDRTALDRIFKVPIRFDQAESCIVIADADMAHRLASGDAQRRARIMAQLSDRLKEAMPSAAARTRHLLKPQILRGDPSFTGMARLIGMHPRTLRRRLAEENLTFEDLIHDVRATMACELLSMTDLPVADISAALSYTVPSNFAHAFRRWTGKTPTAFRRASVSPDAWIRPPAQP